MKVKTFAIGLCVLGFCVSGAEADPVDLFSFSSGMSNTYYDGILRGNGYSNVDGYGTLIHGMDVWGEVENTEDWGGQDFVSATVHVSTFGALVSEGDPITPIMENMDSVGMHLNGSLTDFYVSDSGEFPGGGWVHFSPEFAIMYWADAWFNLDDPNDPWDDWDHFMGSIHSSINTSGGFIEGIDNNQDMQPPMFDDEFPVFYTSTDYRVRFPAGAFVVPEPATLCLLGIGAVQLLSRRRYRQC